MVEALALLHIARDQPRRLAWRTFSVLAWALWITRTKMAIEGIFGALF